MIGEHIAGCLLRNVVIVHRYASFISTPFNIDEWPLRRRVSEFFSAMF